jgi:hypothetical protein
MATTQPEPTYDTVAPLVAGVRQGELETEFTFRCPATGTEVVAAVPLRPGEDRSAAGVRVAKTGAREAGGTARTQLDDRIDRLVPGGGLAADAVRTLVSWRRGSKKQKETIAAAQEGGAKSLVLAAFAQVVDQFVWDDAGGRWVHSG